MIGQNKKWLFWVFQIIGWGALLVLGLIGEYVSTGTVRSEIIQQVGIFFVLALAITYLYRTSIIKLGWLDKSINASIGLVLLGSLGLTILLMLMNFVLDLYFDPDAINRPDNPNKGVGTYILGNFINLYIISLIWNIIYYAFHYFNKSRVQELKNLQLQSKQKESELNNLKNQLNPHFMFNAMNSIRALIDEDPELAKQSVTQLSNLLRNTLRLGNYQVIPLREELKLIDDYIKLEKIRFEERLTFSSDVSQETKDALVPPLLIHTLIENSIKHGISTLAKGGEVKLSISKVHNTVKILIFNDGKLNPSQTNTQRGAGIGLKNAKERLNILYGENANLKIENIDNGVQAIIKIPYKL